jgi:hypothetical protein
MCFIDEDVPYGAVSIEQVLGTSTRAHRACIDIFELLLPRGLRDGNGMLEEIELKCHSKSEPNHFVSAMLERMRQRKVL